ncbi:integrase core domain-containing protein [Actinosynnema sp. NPDC059335]|uniref:integrase core domain-containing protein n=1 Tax=Actinosynnema sp. NPDC059335 TaxID=3346804 RepID=UPI00366F1583
MNAITERWIQSRRRELLDRTLIWNQQHLLHALREYERCYNTRRPHQCRTAATSRHRSSSRHRTRHPPTAATGRPPGSDAHTVDRRVLVDLLVQAHEDGDFESTLRKSAISPA